MAENRFRLVNMATHDIGIIRPSKAQENVQPGRSIYMTLEEIQDQAQSMKYWIMNGSLKCDDTAVYELFGGKPTELIVAMPDGEIEKKLAQPLGAFNKWLNSIDDAGSLRRIFAAAVKMDNISIKKMELIDKKTGFSVMDARKTKEVGQ